MQSQRGHKAATSQNQGQKGIPTGLRVRWGGGCMSLDLTSHLLRCGVGDIYVMLSLASHLLYKTAILFEMEGNFAPLFTLEQRTDSLLLGIVDP